MELTKLDGYDYTILPGVIRIHLQSTTDPVLVDIMSEIHNSRDLIYVEGRYYNYLNEYTIQSNEHTTWIDLNVVEIMADLIPDILKTRR